MQVGKGGDPLMGGKGKGKGKGKRLKIPKLKEPEMGLTAYWIIGLGITTLFMNIGAVASQSWRANIFGMLGYSSRRSWGLFMVQGHKAHWHHEMTSYNCREMSGMNFAGMCNSPLCRWYQTKCLEYFNLAWVSYLTGLFMVLVIFVQALCLYWTFTMDPRLLRWASTWWWVTAITELACIIFYAVMTEDVFAELNRIVYFPEPWFYFSFFLACGSAFCLFINAILGCMLYQFWYDLDPDNESDSSGSGSGSSDSDDSDDDKAKKNKKTQPVVPQQPAGQMYDPNMMAPQQVYGQDPYAQGYTQQAGYGQDPYAQGYSQPASYGQDPYAQGVSQPGSDMPDPGSAYMGAPASGQQAAGADSDAPLPIRPTTFQR